MTEIRSFRTVFDLERRIYRVDRLRLNPSGVPVRGVVYFLAILLATLLVQRLPGIGLLVGAAPWYLRELAAPAALAALFTIITVEGRPFHLAALALSRYALEGRELAGLRPRGAHDRRLRPRELLVFADGSDARLRRLRYTGPGAVLVRVAHARVVPRMGFSLARAWRSSVTLVPLPGKHPPPNGQVVVLAAGARLRVRSERGPRGGTKGVGRSEDGKGGQARRPEARAERPGTGQGARGRGSRRAQR